MFSVARQTLTASVQTVQALSRVLEALAPGIPYDDATEIQIALDDLLEVEKRLEKVRDRTPES